MVELIDGIGPLVERYDGFLLDQYGVLHDGMAPLPAPSPRSSCSPGRARPWC